MTVNAEDPRVIAGLAAQGAGRSALLEAGAVHVGWKAGMGTAAAKTATGLAAPIVGFLTDRTRHGGGSEIGLEGFGNPLLEPEVAVRLGADLPAGSSVNETAAAISHVGPAIEVVDIGDASDLEAVLAGNVFHRAFLLGELEPLTGDLGDVRLRVQVDEQPPLEAIDPRKALGDLEVVVQAIADQLRLAGTGARAGDVIITGSAIPPIPLGTVAQVVVELSGGQVAARFTPTDKLDID
ncbi:MAG: hypothetical protein ACJ762_17085 [Solirubrobacteraceae bacterium]